MITPENHLFYKMATLLPVFLFVILGAAYCAPPEVPCPAPVLLEHGKTFLFEEGRLLKYVCEPGYVLLGKEINRCVEGKWEELNPTCLNIGYENDEDSMGMTFEGLEDEQEENEQQIDDAVEELQLNDEASVDTLMPSLRKAFAKIQRSKKINTSEMKKADKKQSQKNNDNSKADSITKIEDENITLPSLPNDAIPMGDEGYQSDEALRQFYWYAAHYYPYGSPGVMAVTDSQLAWINSLHPELRDQYLRGMHIIRVPDNDKPKRMESLTARDAYDYVYSLPYVRRPVSVVVDKVPSTYDYSCNRAGYPAIPAPRLPNMRVARYDSRKNNYKPHNYYLSAVYQCDPGFYMLDSRFSELYCSRGQWVGHSPVCVPMP